MTPTPPTPGGCACQGANGAAAPEARSAVTVVVYGQAKPKGSLRHVGHGRLLEQVAGSGAWRADVAAAARAVMARPGAPTGPLDGPLAVDATVTMQRPKSAPARRETWPATRFFGDIDKIARNLLDALVDGAVIVDDSRVVDLTIHQRFPGQSPATLTHPGAMIRVWQIGAAR